MKGFTIGYTIFNKQALIPKLIWGIKDLLNEDDEAIFLFDACTDKSLEKFQTARKFLKCQVKVIIPEEELFETKANNRILKEATGDIVILFQDDIVNQDPELKEKISKVIEHYGEDKLGLLGGRSGYELDKDFNQCKRVSNWEHLPGQYGYRLKEWEFKPRTIVNRGPIVLTRSLINEVGYFCERYAPQWCDDADYCCETKFKYGRENVVFQCSVFSPLKWGATRTTSKLKKNWGEMERRNWTFFLSRWGETIKKQHENSIKP